MNQSAYFEQIRQNRKSEILSMAEGMILKDGFASFNMQKIAKELDISTVTLYKYFKNTSDILFSLMELTMQSAVSFFETTPVCANALEAFLLLIQEALMASLRNRKYATLLTLYEIHGGVPTVFSENSLFYGTYVTRILQALSQQLTMAQSQGIISSQLVVDESMDFILTLCTSLLEHIALLDADTFEIRKPILSQNVHQLISLIRFYLR